jgi:hypothetical protein
MYKYDKSKFPKCVVYTLVMEKKEYKNRRKKYKEYKKEERI